MKTKQSAAMTLALIAVVHIVSAQSPDGFTSLFNGRDFTGWKLPAGDNGHWRIVDGVIDYDAESEAKEKDLWTERTYRDFILRVDWRIKNTPYVNPGVPIIRFDGTHKKDAAGREIRISVPDSDSGIFLRGTQQGAGEHLELADRIGRGVRVPHGCEDAGGRARRSDAKAQRRPGHRRLEHV